MRVLGFVLLLGMGITVCGTGKAQQEAPRDANTSETQPVHSEILAFRLPKWKNLHFNDAAKAEKHASTVEQLGCEVQRAAHDGHTDVSYRCVQWQSLTLKNHEEAESWAKWLGQAGFDVSHAHVDKSFQTGESSVAFELSEWKTIHGKGGESDSQLIEQLRKMGCEVRVSNHGNHLDIRYRAPIRRALRFENESHAVQYSAWLKNRGFETTVLR